MGLSLFLEDSAHSFAINVAVLLYVDRGTRSGRNPRSGGAAAPAKEVQGLGTPLHMLQSLSAR